MHISEERLTKVVSNGVVLSPKEMEHLSTCLICLEELRGVIRKDLSSENNSAANPDV
jgi:hypothetical protein